MPRGCLSGWACPVLPPFRGGHAQCCPLSEVDMPSPDRGPWTCRQYVQPRTCGQGMLRHASPGCPRGMPTLPSAAWTQWHYVQPRVLARGMPRGPKLRPPGVSDSDAAGSRLQCSTEVHAVNAVDALWAELAGGGLGLLNRPMDRPWAIRTANVSHPAGHIGEVAAPPAQPAAGHVQSRATRMGAMGIFPVAATAAGHVQSRAADRRRACPVTGHANGHKGHMSSCCGESGACPAERVWSDGACPAERV